MRQNNCVQQTPDANVAVYGNPGFHVSVWPLRARHSPDTAQLTQSVMFHNVPTTAVVDASVGTQPSVFSHSRTGSPS